MKTATALVVLLLVTAMPARTLAAGPPTRSPGMAAARAERLALGLDASPATLAALVGSAADVGTPTWGIAMTAAEAARVDLAGRTVFAADVRAGALPLARSLPGFGGAWFDAASNGELVVALSAHDAAAEAAIRARMPAGSRGLRFVVRPVREAALAGALRATEAAWPTLLPDVVLRRASVDLPGGRLTVEVDADAVTRVTRTAPALAAALGADVDVRVAEPDQDTACRTRDACINPFRAGIRIYRGAIDSVPECTMAFHVIVYSANLDAQFLTAGHCGYGGSNSWLNPAVPGSHVIGSEQATLYRNNGYDVMRVGMADAQASDLVFGDPRHLLGSIMPIIGTPVCDSRGRSNVIDCGTVRSTDVRWLSDTAGYYVYGGSTNGIAGIPGDSGSPLFERYTATQSFADGIVDTANGNFTILFDALGPLSADVWTPA